DQVGRPAQDPRADRHQRDADDREQQDQEDLEPLRPQLPDQPLRGRGERAGLLTDHAAAHGATTRAGTLGDPLGLPELAGLGGGLGVGHAASSAESWDAPISWYVVDVASSCWCVPRSTMTPSSSTRITSASRIVETRWATIRTVASRVTGRRAARSRASVARSRAEKESSNR